MACPGLPIMPTGPQRHFHPKAVCSNPRHKREGSIATARAQAERVALRVGLKCVVVRGTDRRDRTKKECQQCAIVIVLARKEHPINFQWTLKGRSNEF